MPIPLTLIRQHNSYARDAFVLGLIGFSAAFVYFFLNVFTAVLGGASVVVMLFAIVCIFRLRKKFKPASYEFRWKERYFTVWDGMQFDEGLPCTKELVSWQRDESGVLLVIKEMGATSIRNKILLDEDGYGKENLQKLLQFLGAKGEPDIQLPTKLFHKRRKLPAETAGYLITLGLFFAMDVTFNEDPRRHSWSHSIVSPVDYEVVLTLAELGTTDENAITRMLAQYQLQNQKIYKMFPKRYVSIEDFRDSLFITHRLDYQEQKLVSVTLEFSSAYDEQKLKRVYEFIAQDIRNSLVVMQ